MKRLARVLLIAALALGILAVAVAFHATARMAIKAKFASDTERAQISARALLICATEMVGCSLSFEQIKQVLAEQEAARGCR